ncbi:MAG: amino-acid N-acetyltransferase [Spirochaetales bacterium]|nr:amino-acid N-acetyltransferase [Spirochaetales bacterium]
MDNSSVQKAQNIRDVIRYLQKFKNALVVIYLDDKIINSPLFSSHIRDIALLHKAGLKVVIIPGAKQRIDQVLQDAKIQWNYKDNIRVTNQEAMPLIKMAAFDVSNIVMTSLAANNITAVIGNWVRSRAKGILEGYDFGTAGEIEKLEVNAIQTVLEHGFIPIFPCIGWNSTGHPYNISSAELSQQVAINLKADKLFFVMKDGGIDSSRYFIPENFALSDSGEVPAMNLEEVEIFLKKNIHKNETVEKILALAKTACNNGVTRVHILNGEIDGVLPCEIFSDLGSGTMIYSNDYGKIRNMERTDIPAILSIMNPFIQNGKLLPRSEKQLEESMQDFIVYELDGGVHACACLHFYDKKQAEISAVAVDENFSHMGIGPKIIEHLISKAKKEKIKSVFIMTTQASDWFEKLGFTEDKIESIPEERKKIWTPQRNSKVFRLNF